MTDLPVLDAVEQRVLGCLLEKQVTVPTTYPLTLNALRTACNQTSSRDPVMDLDVRAVETTARALRDRGLLRVVWADSGRRILKYHQRLDEALELAADERALVTVLLLRGAQAPGELRSRTERLHPFADRDVVDACLHRLSGRPLVRAAQPHDRGRQRVLRHHLPVSERSDLRPGGVHGVSAVAGHAVFVVGDDVETIAARLNFSVMGDA